MLYDNFMTYQEFQRQLGKAGLSVKEFSSLVGMTPNSVTNYARRESVPTHLAVISKLMGEMAEHGVDFRSPLSGLGVAPKKPRGSSRKLSQPDQPDQTEIDEKEGTVSKAKGGEDE